MDTSTAVSTQQGVVTTTNETIQAASLTPGFGFNNVPLGERIVLLIQQKGWAVTVREVTPKHKPEPIAFRARRGVPVTLLGGRSTAGRIVVVRTEAGLPLYASRAREFTLVLASGTYRVFASARAGHEEEPGEPNDRNLLSR